VKALLCIEPCHWAKISWWQPPQVAGSVNSVDLKRGVIEETVVFVSVVTVAVSEPPQDRDIAAPIKNIEKAKAPTAKRFIPHPFQKLIQPCRQLLTTFAGNQTKIPQFAQGKTLKFPIRLAIHEHGVILNIGPKKSERLAGDQAKKPGGGNAEVKGRKVR
jgi:hypothetical protein